MGGRAEGKTLTKPTRVRGRHLGTRLSLMPKGREEVGVSSGTPLGPEIPRVPFSLNSPKEWRLSAEDEATYLSALPARGLRPSVVPPAWSSAAAPALSPAAPAASLARDPPPPAARVPLRASLRAGPPPSPSRVSPLPCSPFPAVPKLFLFPFSTSL